jgi:hypothetical protein
MSLTSIDGKISAFYCLETFEDCFLSIDAKDIKIPPFDAYHYDNSSKYWFIFLRLLDDELMRLNLQKKRSVRILLLGECCVSDRFLPEIKSDAPQIEIVR